MKASLRAVRIAPKKANLIAKMVRGKSVLQAVAELSKTNKKAARLLQALIESAIADASHNEGQQPESLVIRSLIVNKAQAYNRGVPMARGRIRPMRKFMSHIHLTLGVRDDLTVEEGAGDKKKPASEKGKKGKVASQSAKKTVQSKRSSATAGKASSGKGVPKAQTAPDSENSAV